MKSKLAKVLSLTLLLGSIPGTIWLSANGYIPTMIEGHSTNWVYIFLIIAFMIIAAFLGSIKRIFNSNFIEFVVVTTSIIFVVLIISGITFFLTRYLYAINIEEIFNPNISKYTQMYKTIKKEPYVRGKIIAIDLNRKKIDKSITRLIPKYLQAHSPMEVGTILQLEWEFRVTGRYTTGSEAKRVYCDVSLIDTNLNQIIFKKNFAGTKPPGLKSTSLLNRGSNPKEDIVVWLQNLPRI